ncbi:hypothetical protein [Actinoplanes awajinensis]|uniref:Uncharacterized protein n=1 Tax=Actinoplanes awajinensis subsp. mycoplanecinus TaxID=135947 RepID=A0A101JPZ8_9ACTN|nr:hypothetical protein [Actinoplanes awajinensis]KUL30887.1 hypothetical protein ADL15_23305 [Actinoplanes awajinensis subsp. mycoplanecinus]
MTDHWGGFDHHDDDGLPDFGETHDLPDTHELPDVPVPDHDPDLHELPELDHHDLTHHDPLDDDGHDQPDHAHDTVAATDDFPPALDVGDLPEPVDGFPWVDATTLGSADTYTPPLETVDPLALAAHAGVEIPDGADPWATLAASDDPAISALARWWTPGEQ